MFGWFRKKDPPRLLPESKWVVAIDADTIRLTDDAGAVKELLKRDLSGVIIETNDSGPWGADVWWLLFGAEDRVVLAVPQGATGEDAMLDHLFGLPGFNHGDMIKAMACGDNAVFPVWRRTD